MNRSALVVTVALAVASSGPTPAPSSSASIRATSSSVASAAPPAASGSAAVPAWKVIHGADVPSGESPPPSASEWREGQRVAPTRGRAERCELTLVREWLRVRCPGLVGAGLVAGEARGVSVHVVGRLLNDGMPGDVATLLVLPVRRGEARIVSFSDTMFEYDSVALAEGGLLSVSWRTGRTDPVLVMSGIPSQPADLHPGVGPE